MSGGHSDISDIIPKDILADIELEKSDPSYTSMVTEELIKLKSKEEPEKNAPSGRRMVGGQM